MAHRSAAFLTVLNDNSIGVNTPFHWAKKHNIEMDEMYDSARLYQKLARFGLTAFLALIASVLWFLFTPAHKVLSPTPEATWWILPNVILTVWSAVPILLTHSYHCLGKLGHAPHIWFVNDIKKVRDTLGIPPTEPLHPEVILVHFESALKSTATQVVKFEEEVRTLSRTLAESSNQEHVIREQGLAAHNYTETKKKFDYLYTMGDRFCVLRSKQYYFPEGHKKNRDE